MKLKLLLSIDLGKEQELKGTAEYYKQLNIM